MDPIPPNRCTLDLRRIGTWLDLGLVVGWGVCVLRMSEGPRACGSGCAAEVAEFFGLSMPHSSNSALHVMSGSSQRNAQMKKGRSFTPATLLL